jgi:hypothetical protein
MFIAKKINKKYIHPPCSQHSEPSNVKNHVAHTVTTVKGLSFDQLLLLPQCALGSNTVLCAFGGSSWNIIRKNPSRVCCWEGCKPQVQSHTHTHNHQTTRWSVSLKFSFFALSKDYRTRLHLTQPGPNTYRVGRSVGLVQKEADFVWLSPVSDCQ